jgi:uncharacterized protein
VVVSEGRRHVDVRVYAELNDFLPPGVRGTTLSRPVRPHQTVKDIVEALGVPHTEIDLVVVDGEPVGFGHRPASGARLAVYPVFESVDIGPVGRLRPEPLREPRFVADVHLGRLARLLRLVGFDTRWRNDLTDEELATIGRQEHRILLTRDRGLLKRREVTHGLYVRSDDPQLQVVHVIRRLDLGARLAPFSRCLRCGGALAKVPKAEVVDRLGPVTRARVDEFRRCAACAHVYWRGAHHDALVAQVARIRRALGPDAAVSGGR